LEQKRFTRFVLFSRKNRLECSLNHFTLSHVSRNVPFSSCLHDFRLFNVAGCNEPGLQKESIESGLANDAKLMILVCDIFHQGIEARQSPLHERMPRVVKMCSCGKKETMGEKMSLSPIPEEDENECSSYLSADGYAPMSFFQECIRNGFSPRI